MFMKLLKRNKVDKMICLIPLLFSVLKMTTNFGQFEVLFKHKQTALLYLHHKQ